MTPDAPRVREDNVCPEWVIRCAHWDDVILVLAKDFTIPANCTYPWSRGDGRFTLSEVEGFKKCPCGCGFVSTGKVLWYRYFDSETAALSAFYDAEILLLGE